MTAARWSTSSLQELQERRRALVARSWRRVVTWTGISVLGLGALVLAERAALAWLLVGLAALLCVYWGWALLTLLLEWGGLLLAQVAAGMHQAADTVRTGRPPKDLHPQNRGGGHE